MRRRRRRKKEGTGKKRNPEKRGDGGGEKEVEGGSGGGRRSSGRREVKEVEGGRRYICIPVLPDAEATGIEREEKVFTALTSDTNRSEETRVLFTALPSNRWST